MAAIAKLYATLGLDNRGFLQGLTQSQSALGRFGGAVAGGLGFGAGFGGIMLLERGIRQVVDGFGDAVTAASNMTETQTKLDQVFMHSADSMRDWSEGAAQTMIMSEQAALASAATFGNFLQALEVGEDVSAGMSRGLVMLSADLASYNNLAGGAEEATMRLFSGMSGEMEAVRRLGIDLSETAVTTYLLANGVKRVGTQFRQSDKTMARYALIMKDTAKAQGDVERTGMNLANRQREFNAEVGNLQAALGAGLVGPMADFTGWLADVVGVFSGNDSLNRKIDDFTAKVLGLADATGKVSFDAGGSGLGSFEDMFADLPGMDLVFPALARNTRLWREHHDILEKVGFDYYSFGGFFDMLVKKTGKTDQEVMDLVLAFTKLDEANRRVAAGIQHDQKDAWSWIQGFRGGMDPGNAFPIFDAVLGAFDSFQTGWTISKEDAIDTMEQTFRDLRQSIKSGFGSVKDALSGEGGKQTIDPAVRMRNMQNRLVAATAELRHAVEVGDPFGISYWDSAVAKQRLNLQDYRKQTLNMNDRLVSDMKSRTQGFEEAGRAQGRAQGRGYRAALATVMANAVSNVIQNMGEALAMGITNINGPVYGGPAGLRALSAEIDRANRPTRRERRRNRLAEG